MILAAINPDNWLGLVIVDMTVDPPRVLLEDGWEIGTLAKRDAPITRKGRTFDLERVTTPEDAKAAGERVVATCQSYGVTTAIVQRRGRRGRSWLRADAVIAALTGAGIPVRPASIGKWDRVDRAKGRLAGYVGRHRPIQAAAQLVLAEIDGPVERPAVQWTEGTTVRAPRSVVVAGPRPVVPRTVAPVRPVVARRAGIDPGSRYVSVCIGEGASAPLTLVAPPLSLEIGTLVPLKKRRLLPNGAWQTHRRSVTGDDVDALTVAVVAYLREHSVTRAVIEHIEHVFGADGHVVNARAGELAVTGWVAGNIRQALVGAGVEVIEVKQATARARVVGRGKGKGGSSPERIPAAVASMVSNWTHGDAHEYDAAVYMLTDVITERALKVRRKTERKPDENEAARAELRAKHGCQCKRRHVRECYFFEPRNYPGAIA